MPMTFGTITHSAPSMNVTRIHSLIAHGSTPAVSARLPNTIRRWMWCPYARRCNPATVDSTHAIAVGALPVNAGGTGRCASSALRER